MTKKETDLVRLLHGKTKSLSLCGKKLSQLPESIGLLQSLISLDVRNNQLNNLPDSFHLLHNLNSLHLGGNKFESIPHEVSDLIQLQKLQLFCNPLVDITAICSASMVGLRILNLNSCQLTELPSEIKHLQSLEVLSLSFNKLTSLPPELCKLINLKELHVDNNQLNSLPFEVGHLRSLNKLLAPHNHISELPESLTRLKRLRVLDIACNQVRIFPTELGTMSLRELYCEQNPLIEQNVVKSVQEEEILTLKELSARFVMREVKKRGSVIRENIHYYPGVKELMLQSARCEICSDSFLNTWLECVRFVSVGRLNIKKCTVTVLPQRVLLCSYKCFNSQGHDFYGVAFP